MTYLEYMRKSEKLRNEVLAAATFRTDTYENSFTITELNFEKCNLKN